MQTYTCNATSVNTRQRHSIKNLGFFYFGEVCFEFGPNFLQLRFIFEQYKIHLGFGPVKAPLNTPMSVNR